MVVANRTEAIKTIHFFQGLTDPEIDQIAAICKEQSLGVGETIQEEGKTDNQVHLILAGKIARIAHIPNVTSLKSEIILDVLHDGDVYGWSCLLKGSSTATLRVIDPTKILNLSATALLDLCEKEHHIGFIVMRNLSTLIASKLKRNRMSILNAIVAIRGEC
jgi:CRP/FNR family cyclic AMP-dependent transcriptional regulator